MSKVKIIGGLLLLFGIGIILGSLYLSYNIFRAKVLPPEIFALEKPSLPKGISQSEEISPELSKDEIKNTLQEQLQGQLQEQLKGLLPTDTIPRLLNLFSWSIFAGIMIFAGTQISSLGIKMIK